MAMIAHILGLTGWVGPLILYLVKKDEASKFLKFHMLQSLWFQVAMVIVYVALGILTGVASVLTAGIGGCICMPIIMLV